MTRKEIVLMTLAAAVLGLAAARPVRAQSSRAQSPFGLYVNIAYVNLGTPPRWMALLTLAGIGWVVASHEDAPDLPGGNTRRGVIFGILAALGQAVGLVFSKQGMTGDFSPFQANAIRMLAAVLFVWVWAALDGKACATITGVRGKPRIIGLLALGAFVGPVLGVSSSLFAIQHAEIGVASTLMALTPVILLPISHFVFHERVGWQAIFGTMLAITGVAILFLA